MVNEVYIEKEEGTAYRVDLAPVHMCEDTYTKSPEIESLESDPEDGLNPETGIYDTKKTLHKFVLTGVLTLNDGDAVNGVTSISATNPNASTSKKGRLRLLYGYGGIERTRLKFYYNGQVYYGFMTRLSLIQSGGENFYDYIIEITEGLYYDDISY